MAESIRTLLLNLAYPHRTSYYDDWAEAFQMSPEFKTSLRSLFSLNPRRLVRIIRDYDAIVLLHSCTADSTGELARIAPVLANRDKTRLLAFVGNEYNSLHALISDKLSVLRACRPDVIATQLLEEAGQYLYEGVGAQVRSVPHALNPHVFAPGKPHRQRSIDIGVRGSRYSSLLGDDDRNRIVDHFRSQASRYGVIANIKTAHRFNRRNWAAFLGECRGTVSSEAGSWFLQRDDAIVREIGTYLTNRQTGLAFGYASGARSLARRLPLPLKALLANALRSGPIRYAAFEELKIGVEELRERFFRPERRCPAYSKALSSRHLDAVGTRTCQLLLAGRYNDILKPNEHYIPISENLGDVEDAVSRFKDEAERKRIVSRAYDHVMGAHTYPNRMAELHGCLAELL